MSIKYFLTEQERKSTGSTNYYEFQKGAWNARKQAYWRDDSINLSTEHMYLSKFDALIFQVVPAYSPFGVTRIAQEQWRAIYELAKERGGELFSLVMEANRWVEDNYKEHPVFTILGL